MSLPEAAPKGGFRHTGEMLRYSGWHISVVKARFEDPEGSAFERDIVRHPGAVAVAPVTDSGTVLLVRQYRGSVDELVLEIPAGTRDVPGEPPAATAARELAEEVGMTASSWKFLAQVLNSPGFCDERTDLFLATGLRACNTAREGPEERHMEVVEVPLCDIASMIATGMLVDAQTITCLLLAVAHLA